MIHVRLMGGMGNQLFQYAAGRRLAIHWNTALILDCSWFVRDADRAASHRRYELDCFDLPAMTTVLSPETIHRWEYCNRHPVRSRLSRYMLRKRVAVFRSTESDMRFEPSVLAAPASTLLIGYWQSERYFSDVESEIRSDLAFSRPIAPNAEALLKQIKSGASIAVHVRRGDYVTDAGTARFLGALPSEYFSAAVDLISQHVPTPTLYVFSDDIGWCRENLEFSPPTVYVEGSGWHSGVDLNLMGACDHHVISNSTFGWWGAWLNPSEAKIVIAPRRWFKDASVDGSDLVPAGWCRI